MAPSKQTYTHVLQCSPTSVGLAQAHPNNNRYIGFPEYGNTTLPRQQTAFVLHYSVAYFDCITALQCRTSVQGRAQMHYIDLSDIHASSLHALAPPLMEVLHHSALNPVTQSNCATE